MEHSRTAWIKSTYCTEHHSAASCLLTAMYARILPTAKGSRWQICSEITKVRGHRAMRIFEGTPNCVWLRSGAPVIKPPVVSNMSSAPDGNIHVVRHSVSRF